ncbi:MAG: hypothetical protein MUE30_03140 [Spirosomaceae bacterium]|jgi:lysophospholipase L1-like esterase|nr:hypothetical protein [Spirosomataceae bacterium]
MKFLRKSLLFLVGLLVLTELTLRFIFGFCNAPLYVEDPDFEYIYAPNQHRTRFRNVIKTNEHSMRSEPLHATDTTVVLLLGDSVINGGNPTDHDDLASTILENQLNDRYQKPVRVLNVSAGSWGPDNAFAYLKKRGFFGADLICLVTSSHDAFDNISHTPLVGLNPNYPNKQYEIALYEAYDRYYIYYEAYIETPLKRWFGPATQHAPDDVIHKFGTTFNRGFQQLADTTRALQIPFVIYLHPEIPEIQQNRFDAQGTQILAFAQQNRIPVVNELTLRPTLDLFRNPEYDGIHYNAKGQAFMAKNLSPVIQQYLDLYFARYARSHRP